MYDVELTCSPLGFSAGGLMVPLKHRMLIINFNGLGNGLWIVPLLKRLEEVDGTLTYFHISNPIFEVAEIMKWAALKGFKGTVPSYWRRFSCPDWSDIKVFLKSQGITLIINLRNEGPLRDIGYFQFKKEMQCSGVEFWELDQAAIAQRTSQRALLLDQIDLLKAKGINLHPVNQRWLRDCLHSMNYERKKFNEIGFFTGASQSVKRWSAEQWIELGELILGRSNQKVVIYAGDTDDELILARHVNSELRKQFGTKCCRLISGRTIWFLARHISGLNLLVSNDTFSVHMAACLDVPVMGLYFSTDSAIWGGASDNFIAVQSQLGLNCPEFKPDAGNCNAYYGGCPGPCKVEVSPAKVFARIEQVLSCPPKHPVAMTQAIERKLVSCPVL